MDWQTIVLLIGLTVAVCWDLHSRRIPNFLTLSMALLGITLFALQQGAGGLLFSLQGLLIGFAFFVIPFALGGLGGGDVKLAMAVGALTGPHLALYTVLYSAIAGGVVAAGAALAYQYRKETDVRVAANAQGLRGLAFPYAVAIASGTVLALCFAPIAR